MSCPTGKKRYATWSHATFDARQMRRHKSNGSNRELPYACRDCDGFHVGHQTTRKTRKMKEM